MRYKKHIVFAALLVIFTAPAYAYFGARPMGMGGAFTAIADDANAAYWNPAGFAFNPGVDITGSTLLTNRNAVMGDNLAAVKMCYEAPMSSPFEWIFGVGVMSAFAVQTAQYLGDQGILKKNWGPSSVPKTGREQSMAPQVKEKGTDTSYSRNPVKRATPKPDAQKSAGIFGPIQNLTINMNFAPHGHTYWDNRYENPGDLPYNKAQFALGLTWLNDINPALDEFRNWYTVSVASGWEERVAVGANLNFYDLKVISTGIKGFGAGIDLGAIGKPLPNLSLGLAVKEILTTDINWQNGAVTRYSMLVNAGAAIKPIDEITIAVDGHNVFAQNVAGGEKASMHYGVEVRPIRGIAIRAGLYDGSKTAGASVGVGGFIVDYAYLGGAFDKTQMVGATWKF
ncbi:MAG: hypothetical protein NTZ10_05925 [Candidatus Saganbacteria bacterium]|nr:hypothetical protein [Candidatus Saganbacteria bacterium]